MRVRPIRRDDLKAFIRQHHRHNGAPQGDVLRASVTDDAGDVVGVACAGRPVARGLADPLTLEVTRVCVLEGYPNACTMLLGALCRAAKALGYRTIYTYTLESEPGSSVKAAGFTRDGAVKARSSFNTPSRPRSNTVPKVERVRWKKELGK